MSSLHPARRRAERFDAAIEGSSTAALDPRVLELVEVVEQLRSAPRPVAREDFVSDLRGRLMAAAETDLAAQPARTPAAPRRGRRDRRVAAAIGGFALVGATASMAVAAQSALPGDTLYPLKRAIENADTGLTADQADKGNALLDHASVRLRELDKLSEGLAADRADATETHTIERTLTTFSAQATEASDLLLAQYAATGSEQAITTLRTFTGDSIDSLSRLELRLPDAARPAVVDAAKVLFEIDLEAADACPQCEGRGIPQIPAALMSADLGETIADLQTDLVPATTEAAPKPKTGAGKPKKPAATASASASATPNTTTEAQPGIPGIPDPTILTGGNAPVPGDGKSGSGGKNGKGGGLGTVIGGLLGGDTTTTTTTSTGPTATPAPLPTTLGQILENTVDTVNQLTDPLLKPK